MSEILHAENLQKFIQSIELKEKTHRYRAPNHGSSTGDIISFPVYFNPLTLQWDDKANAILGHVIVACRPHIKEIIEQETKKEEA